MGLLTSLLSAAAFNFFHLPPTGQFDIASGENWVALGVFLVVAAVTSTLAGAVRTRASQAERDRAEAGEPRAKEVCPSVAMPGRMDPVMTCCPGSMASPCQEA